MLKSLKLEAWSILNAKVNEIFDNYTIHIDKVGINYYNLKNNNNKQDRKGKWRLL